MSKYVLLAALLFMFTAATVNVSAQMQPDIEITDVWARPTASGMAMNEDEEGMMDVTSAVYMTINNTGDAPVTLLAAETDIASAVEIHETTIDDNDVMRMRPVESALEIPAGEGVELRPGGFHLMLLDAGELVTGDAFALTLTFQVADDNMEIVIGAPVQDEPPMPSDVFVTQAWARPTANEPMGMDTMATEEAMEMGGTSAAYMFIENTGDEDVTLIGGITDAAGIVEIHETSMGENDVMQMRPLTDGLTIPAGESVQLRPGGFHVMFLDLQEPFVNGTALYLELEFDNGETLPIGVPIEDRLGMPMSMGE